MMKIKDYYTHTNQKIRALSIEVSEWLFSKMDDPVDVISKMFFKSISCREHLFKTLENKYLSTQKAPPLFTMGDFTASQHTNIKGSVLHNNFMGKSNIDGNVRVSQNSIVVGGNRHHAESVWDKSPNREAIDLNSILPEKIVEFPYLKSQDDRKAKLDDLLNSFKSVEHLHTLSYSQSQMTLVLNIIKQGLDEANI